MKRYGHLYEKVHDIENIKLAILKASKGKRNRHSVKKVIDNIDYYALEVKDLLINKKYTPSPYIEQKIYDGSNKKERIIHKPKFYPDQVIHWALMLQIENIILKGMYEHCCGSVPGRGSSHGHKYIKKWISKDIKNTKYCLKLDVSKFYQSIDHRTLKNCFEKKFKDKDLLELIYKIIDSTEKGLPIGNFTSQWFANFLLQDLDHHIKEQLKVKYYTRYIDDMVLFGPNKKKLHKAKTEIENILKTYGLSIKGNWQVFRVDDRGIDFLGFRFYRNKTILRKRNALRIRRRVKRIHKRNKITYKDACAIVSYWGWIKRSNSFYFYNKYIKPYITIKKVRLIISAYNKQYNANICI